ncbi:MAG: uridine diphosphate-N-acetylglucosamine-binding protein YvcK [Candidatus Micrarchaeota archaeon]
MAAIKAIFFDLDDTLFDLTGTIGITARKKAIIAMIKAGLLLSKAKALQKIDDFYRSKGPNAPVFELLAKIGTKNPKKQWNLTQTGLKEYYSSELPSQLKPFDDVIPCFRQLQKQKIKLFLVTMGAKKRQLQKIKLLKLSRFFDQIEVHDPQESDSKENHFKKILKKFRLKPSECVSVGDRLHSEIKISNRLGMHTVHMQHGRYANLAATNEFEEADYSIKKISELPGLLPKIENRKTKKPQIVLIGGGTGLSNLLSGLKKFPCELTAIVTVTDTGKSSGKLREDFCMLPPGDIRNCLAALSTREEFLKKLFQYRFENGSLNGHSFGNLFLAALTQLTGSFEKAVTEASRILAIQGRVIPATLENSQIGVELKNGEKIIGEDNIVARNEPVHRRSPIQKAFLVPQNAKASKDAVASIQNADLLIIGPGCLYTSVVSNLLIKDISNAVQKSKAKTVYVCNIMTQQGQTDHFSASQHAQIIAKYLQKFPDYVLVNTRVPPSKNLAAYEKEHAFMVRQDKEVLADLPSRIVYADLLQKHTKKKSDWNRRDYLRHDSDKIAKVLMKLV